MDRLKKVLLALNAVVFYFAISQSTPDFILFFLDIMQRVWDPLLEKLKSYVKPCGIGYIDMMINHATDTQESLETQNARLLQHLFKMYGELFANQIPYIKNGELRAIYAQAVKGNKQQEDELSKGIFDLDSINQFFKTASNGLNDFLNSH